MAVPLKKYRFFCGFPSRIRNVVRLKYTFELMSAPIEVKNSRWKDLKQKVLDSYQRNCKFWIRFLIANFLNIFQLCYSLFQIYYKIQRKGPKYEIKIHLLWFRKGLRMPRQTWLSEGCLARWKKIHKIHGSYMRWLLKTFRARVKICDCCRSKQMF